MARPARAPFFEHQQTFTAGRAGEAADRVLHFQRFAGLLAIYVYEEDLPVGDLVGQHALVQPDHALHGAAAGEQGRPVAGSVPVILAAAFGQPVADGHGQAGSCWREGQALAATVAELGDPVGRVCVQQTQAAAAADGQQALIRGVGDVGRLVAAGVHAAQAVQGLGRQQLPVEVAPGFSIFLPGQTAAVGLSLDELGHVEEQDAADLGALALAARARFDHLVLGFRSGLLGVGGRAGIGPRLGGFVLGASRGRQQAEGGPQLRSHCHRPASARSGRGTPRADPRRRRARRPG